MRKTDLSLALNLTTGSLSALDQFVDPIIDAMLVQKLNIQTNFETGLFEEIVAYVGEVVVRARAGRWIVADKESHAGPLVVFQDGHGQKNEYRGIDIANEVAVQLPEGNSFARWFQSEVGGLPK